MTGALLTRGKPITQDMATALKSLMPLRHLGYTLEPSGACVRIWGKRVTRDSCRYLSVASLLEQDEPAQYALAAFADRW